MKRSSGKKRGLGLTTQRGAKIFKRMLSARRAYCTDAECFRMTDFWEALIEEESSFSIKKYKSSADDEFLRRAAVLRLDTRVTLIVDQQLWEGAAKGKGFHNFLLAHEAAHLELDHHVGDRGVKNFRLGTVGSVKSVIAQDETELEAHFGGVVLQCGLGLLNGSQSHTELAHRAYSDPAQVKWVQNYVQLDVFRRELSTLLLPLQRLIL